MPASPWVPRHTRPTVGCRWMSICLIFVGSTRPLLAALQSTEHVESPMEPVDKRKPLWLAVQLSKSVCGKKNRQRKALDFCLLSTASPYFSPFLTCDLQLFASDFLDGLLHCISKSSEWMQHKHSLIKPLVWLKTQSFKMTCNKTARRHRRQTCFRHEEESTWHNIYTDVSSPGIQ